MFCLESGRQVTNDWAVPYGPRWLQIEREAKVQPGDRIPIREYRKGRIKLFHHDREIARHELPERPQRKAPATRKARRVSRTKPAAAHPWQQRAVGARA